VWLSLLVPLAILLAALLLQRLEAKLLRAPETVEHPAQPAPNPSDHPTSQTIGPPPDPAAPPRRQTGPSTARATA
jgi:hypothetical protein